MRYIIDGYNLLHALGLARTYGGKSGWERARSQLLDWLADRHGASATNVIVALDAQNAWGRGVVVEKHRGLNVMRKPSRSADDLIEDLINSDHAPSEIVVVSNDARVRRAAQVRGCQLLKCSEYVDSLLRTAQKQTSSEPTAEKPTNIDAAEAAELLEAFS